MLACKYRPGRKTEAPSWIRGLVLRPAKPHAFFIFYVDYGTEEEVYFKNAKNLDTKFSVLPNQAIRARLSGIQPKSGGMAYLLESMSPFKIGISGHTSNMTLMSNHISYQNSKIDKKWAQL